MLREGEALPEIYKDPAFSLSSKWELSTSQLSSKYLDGWGYGEGPHQGTSTTTRTDHPFFSQLFRTDMACLTRSVTTMSDGQSRVLSLTRKGSRNVSRTPQRKHGR